MLPCILYRQPVVRDFRILSLLEEKAESRLQIKERRSTVLRAKQKGQQGRIPQSSFFLITTSFSIGIISMSLVSLGYFPEDGDLYGK